MMFLHRFEQGALRLGSRAIHFVNQHHLRKERPLMKNEALLLAIENRIAQNISRQQVAGKLNPLKSGADRSGQSLRQCRLTNSGNVFDQQMTAREQARHCEFHRLDLANNNLTNLRAVRTTSTFHMQQSSESEFVANIGSLEIRISVLACAVVSASFL